MIYTITFVLSLNFDFGYQFVKLSTATIFSPSIDSKLDVNVIITITVDVIFETICMDLPFVINV